MNPEELFEIEIVDYPDDYYFRTDLDYKYFNPNLYCTSRTDSKLMETAVKEIYNELDLQSPNFIKSKKLIMLNSLLTNLLDGYFMGKVVAMPRDKSRYSRNKRVNNKRSVNYKNKNLPRLSTYTYKNVEIVDALKAAGYIFMRNGSYNTATKKGKYSRIWASKKLIEKFEQLGMQTGEQTNSSIPDVSWIYRLVKEKSVKKDDVVLIQLKNEKKELIGYKKSNEIKNQETFLKKYNKFLSGVEVKISLASIFNHYKQPIDNYYNKLLNNQYIYSTNSNNLLNLSTTQYTTSSPLLRISDDNYSVYKNLVCDLYRVYNDCVFTRGGRYYGAEYQGFPEELRKHILINGNKTIEADFKAMHPRMLYHLKGIEYPGDPYLAISDVSSIRTPIKVMFQMIINALNPMKALNAFKDAARAEPDLLNSICEQGIDPYTLMQLIIEAHTGISDFFNSGIGIELQYKDSIIAEQVMKHFLNKNIACLCVHDSFIVEEQYREELVDVMKREYKKVMGFEGVVEVG